MGEDRCDVLITEDVDGPALRRPLFPWSTRRISGSDPAAVRAAVRGCRALVVRNRTAVDAELISAAPDLRVIGRAGVGLDNIDLHAAEESGIAVISPTGANARSVAEYTIGLALAMARTLVVHDHRTRSGGWVRSVGSEIGGVTWGLLGVGATGRAVAALAGAFGCRVIGYDSQLPADDPRAAAVEVTLVGLEQVAEESDILSVHLPATPATFGLIDEQFLSTMRPGSMVINVGRGEVIDEAALARALRSGRLRGAALDVRTAEPPVPSELEELDSVILTPHVAGMTVQAQDRITAILAEDITAVLSGGKPTHAVPVAPQG